MITVAGQTVTAVHADWVIQHVLVEINGVFFPASKLVLFPHGEHMDTHNFVLAITTGLLGASTTRLERLFAYFDVRFNLDGNGRPGRPGLLVQDCSAVRLPLKTWVRDMRHAGPAAAMLGLAGHDICGEAYKMAAFAGGRPWTLAIAQRSDFTQFLIGTVSHSAPDDETRVAYALLQRPKTVELKKPGAPRLAREAFQAALADAQDFALRVGSSYSESFRLALLLCGKSAMTGEAELDQGALRVEVAKHFPCDDEAWLNARMAVVDSFDQFEWEAGKVLGLAAISAADVFGGAGSWNDQSFDGTDQALFENISARLYDAMNDYYSALLSA